MAVRVPLQLGGSCPYSSSSGTSDSIFESCAKAARADSMVGKKCVGSIVRVSSYRSIFARTGSFISANTREIPCSLRASSRSSSMSAAVVSTSVMGSAATTIQRGCG